jgi:glycosyltransferase involved in cell wall biosynthesis
MTDPAASGAAPARPLKVLFAGDYDARYNRTQVICEGLAKLGVEIVHLPFRSRTFRAARQVREAGRGADFVFLPSFTHQQVRFVKRALPGTPLLFDPLISKYMTAVFDYREAGRYSIRALRNWLKDKLSLNAADMVLADTLAHAGYYHRHFGVHPARLRVLPVGVNTSTFHPDGAAAPRQDGMLIVGFYGAFAPLQGTGVIVEAIRLLQPHPAIAFEIVGTGFDYPRLLRELQARPVQRLSLPGWVAQEDLGRRINGYDICLGIFGSGIKADVVIPNKVYHYAACARAIVTRDTPAIREVFTPGRDIELVAPGPEALAAKILELKRDPARRQALGRQARRLMEQEYNESRIAERLLAAYRDAAAGVRRPLPGLEPAAA